MDNDIVTRQAQIKIKFFIFDALASFLFLGILIFQNLISVIFFIIFNIIISMMNNRGFPPAMALRKITVMIVGRKKYRHYPERRRDHLFTH